MKHIIYRKQHLWLWILGFGILAALVVWFFFWRSTGPNHFPQREHLWQTVKVKQAEAFNSIKLPAKAKSNQFAIISPRRNGIVQDLLVDIGDEVSKGQTIGSLLPEGVEGQSSAAIAEASAKLQKARAELAEAQGVATEAVSVATQQWRETTLQQQTSITLDQESQKQLEEKKVEAILVVTQAWENVRLVLFGAGNNYFRSVQGIFSDSTQETLVENLALEIQQMEESGMWATPEAIVEHLSHLENFLTETESLYKNAREGKNQTKEQILSNLGIIQDQQLKVSQIKQSILALEEKNKRLASEQAEKEAGSERSKETIDLVQSQQNLNITQAEKNVEVALANYNSALVKAGHQSITSPFDGVITARMVEIGQAVMMNSPLFYLEGASTARSQEALSEVHFSLPESWRGKVSVGDDVTIKSLEGASFEGHIFRLSEQVNLDTGGIMGTAIAQETLWEPIIEPEEVEDENTEDEEELMQEVIQPVDFTHGTSLFVYVTASDSQIFTVPTLALKKRSNAYYLWKMVDNEPLQIQVEVMAEDGEYSQVWTPDLTEGDDIISNPSVSLFTK